MILRSMIILSILLLQLTNTYSQIIPLSYNQFSINKNLINFHKNTIIGDSLFCFFTKLLDLQKNKSRKVRIVHIGDSHLQAGFLTTILRNNFQLNFGNAGRGLIFPYRLAKSNSPSDIISNSNYTWQFNRLAHPEIPIKTGVSGFNIQSEHNGAEINIELGSNNNDIQQFDIIKLYFDDSVDSKWELSTRESTPFIKEIKWEPSDSIRSYVINLDTPATNFSLKTSGGNKTQSFYGAVVEKKSSGVVYNTIAVNGAKYEHFNKSDLFWKQLPSIEADLYIVSLGTNEAQNKNFDFLEFENQIDSFFLKLKTISPQAEIIVTTPADSYSGAFSNLFLREVSSVLLKYCNEKKMPIWDLYNVTLGYGGARKWFNAGFLAKDKIHFNSKAYSIHGALLFNAIAKKYNVFIKKATK